MSEADPTKAKDAGTELASLRTAMAFERTAKAADRTLMAMIRTSLALIGFGFTIFSFFHALNDKFLGTKLPQGAPARFGLSLVSIGIVLLAIGIYTHRADTKARRDHRQELVSAGLIENPEISRPSPSMIAAILVLIVGILAIGRIALHVGPY